MRKQTSKKKLMHTQSDTAGNELRVYMNPEIPHVLTVNLFVFRECRQRTLGIINLTNRKIFMKRERNKHLHRIGNAYGFNYALLKESKRFDTVVLRDEIATWEVPKEIILEKGEFFYYKQTGFERQIFLSLAELENYCIKEKIF